MKPAVLWCCCFGLSTLAAMKAVPGASGVIVVAQEVAEHPLVARVRAATAETRREAVATLWKEIDAHGTPLVAPLEQGDSTRIVVTFVSRGGPSPERSNIGLMGSFVPGGSREVVPLTPVPDTDVLTASFTVDSRSRYRYYFAWPQGRQGDPRAVWRMEVKGMTYELFDDSKSRLSYVDDFEGNPVRTSYFDGPNAPAEPWLAKRQGVVPGTLQTFDMPSAVLGNSRSVSVYLPAGYAANSSRRYPLLVLFDREGYLLSVPTATVLDNLIADRSIPPLMAVLVNSINGEHRNTELAANPRFAAFIAEELLPKVRAQFHVARGPAHTIVAGSSLGGLSAAYVAYQYPKVFGNVLSLSGSYWWHPDQGHAENADDDVNGRGWLPRLYAERSPIAQRFYLSVGAGEGDAMIAPNRLFRDVLTAKHAEILYEELQGDHSYLNWRDGLVTGLQFLLSSDRAR